jgi:hypothetical protein
VLPELRVRNGGCQPIQAGEAVLIVIKKIEKPTGSQQRWKALIERSYPNGKKEPHEHADHFMAGQRPQKNTAANTLG